METNIEKFELELQRGCNCAIVTNRMASYQVRPGQQTKSSPKATGCGDFYSVRFTEKKQFTAYFSVIECNLKPEFSYTI